MADDVDMTQDRMDVENDFRRRAPVRDVLHVATGFCLWCGEPLRYGLRWCDTDCRDDFERAQR